MAKHETITAKNGTKCSLCDAEIGGSVCKYDKENDRYICDKHEIW